jgi:hypothetical protein
LLSLRSALAGIGEPARLPFGLRTTFRGRAPLSLRTALEGMTDPEVARWDLVSDAFRALPSSDNTSDAQGLATDGNRWFLSANGSKRVVVFDDNAGVTAVYSLSQPLQDLLGNDRHIGAPGYYAGVLYVPVQNPYGVWRIDLASGAQAWLRSDVQDQNIFPWCGVNPFNGLLYTINFDTPDVLLAYDRDTLTARAPDNIALGPTPIELTGVQGGVFTPRGRLILVESFSGRPSAVFCFSALNGHCLGAELLQSGPEYEAVAVRDSQIALGPNAELYPVQVHILDNDAKLHRYSVPHPELL